jgi:hypothetical protein
MKEFPDFKAVTFHNDSDDMKIVKIVGITDLGRYYDSDGNGYNNAIDSKAFGSDLYIYCDEVKKIFKKIKKEKDEDKKFNLVYEDLEEYSIYRENEEYNNYTKPESFKRGPNYSVFTNLKDGKKYFLDHDFGFTYPVRDTDSDLVKRAEEWERRK